MKYTALVLLVAFIITPLALVGCDSWNLDDPKIAKLEQKMDALAAEHKKLAKRYNDLVDINRALISEKNDLADRLAMAVVVIKEQDGQIADLNARREHAIGTIDEIMDLFLAAQRNLNKAEETSTWPPKQGDKLSFRIDFDNNQLYNRRDSREIAKMVKAYSKAVNGNIKITVEGYSSKSGAAKLNKALSLERAEGVMFKIYEAFNSTDSLNMEVIAHGETDDDERKVIITVEVL